MLEAISGLVAQVQRCGTSQEVKRTLVHSSSLEDRPFQAGLR